MTLSYNEERLTCSFQKSIKVVTQQNDEIITVNKARDNISFALTKGN